MTKLNVNGRLLECLEQGAGDPVVFVHGSASDHRTWRSQLDDLAREYRVIAYSRRYHWPNDPIPEDADYAMREHVDDLAAVLRALELDAAHLIGHSYGALVALLLAIREPRRVRTLVLGEPPVITLLVSNPPKPAEILKLLVTRPRTALAIMKFGATGIEPATAAARRGDVKAAMRIFGAAVLGPAVHRRLSAERLDQVDANSFRAEFLGSGLPRLNDADLRTMQVPTLLVIGQHSPPFFHRLMDRLEEVLPNAERVAIPGASHITHEDNVAAYDGAVRSFLAAHGRTV